MFDGLQRLINKMTPCHNNASLFSGMATLPTKAFQGCWIAFSMSYEGGTTEFAKMGKK